MHRIEVHNAVAGLKATLPPRFKLLGQATIDLPPVWTLLVNSLRRIEKPFKSTNPGRSERVAIEPGDKANQIDRRRNSKMLQMRFSPRDAQRDTSKLAVS
jgi:hypothetical protein